jgi:hypothetical protein
LKKSLNILICPLEWGLGHAARMIPLAIRLQEAGHNVIIGTGESHKVFFSTEIPEIQCIHFPGFTPRYSAYLPQYLMVLLSLPRLVFHAITEHYRLQKITDEYKTDIVISDNRFGLWHKNITSVYVTHQLRIPFPKGFRMLEFIGLYLHKALIGKFNLCMIPDLPGEINLTGRMSHGIKLPANAIYTGILSRFTVKEQQPGSYPGETNNLVILSGPEPQRSILRRKLLQSLQKNRTPSIILGGDPFGDKVEIKDGNLVIYSHLPADKIRDLICRSKNIIARSGYTTIMELVSLKRCALLIPTPGQTEQDYLARRLHARGWFTTISQGNLGHDLPFPDDRSDFPFDAIISDSRKLLEATLQKLSE